jgi:hypothetical protein
MTEWIGRGEAAKILGVSESSVYRSLSDPAVREEMWGTENEGWRRKPLSTRGVLQVSRERAVELAGKPAEG